MTRKTKAFILFLIYGIALVLVLTFGGEASRFLMAAMRKIVLGYEITDVAVELDPAIPLDTRQSYQIGGTAIGKFSGDGDLDYKSSNTNALYIDSDGRILTYAKFDGTETTVDVTITSSQDSDFKKVITYTVKKVYPPEFNTYYIVKGFGSRTGTMSVGMTVYPYAYPKKDAGLYASTEFEVIYDEEYFRYDEKEQGYIAIKETDPGKQLYFGIRFPGGETKYTTGLTITPYTQIDSFDAIMEDGDNVEDKIFYCDSYQYIRLFKDGSPVQTIFDISCSDPDNLVLSAFGQYYFKDAGDYTLTVTLPNGFSKEVPIKVRNILIPPVMRDDEIEATKHITIYQNSPTTINFDIPGEASYGDVTYEYNEDELTIKGYWRSFIISAKECGTYTFKAVVDDGVERVEEVYTVEVIRETRIFEIIKDIISYFVAKVMGHLCMFGLLGILGYNYMRYVYFRKKPIWLTVAFSLGLPFAFVSEYIQLFMEGRTAGLIDVVIDMSGYVLGLIFCFLFLKLINRNVKKVYLWTAISLEDRLPDLRRAAERVGADIGAANPSLTLPMHISLKISCQVKTKDLPKIVARITNLLSDSGSHEIIPECIERCGGVVWIRHRADAGLIRLHNSIVHILRDEYAIMPHEFDLDFAYHTTLFYGEEADAEKAYDMLKNTPLPDSLTSAGYLIGTSESGKAGEYRVDKRF